jgi:hypothetical protein
MNRYPLWKYLLIAFVVVIATLYTLPNFFGETPAVQVSSGKATNKVDASTRTRVEDALRAGTWPQMAKWSWKAIQCACALPAPRYKSLAKRPFLAL